jgi:hypothetical protein
MATTGTSDLTDELSRAQRTLAALAQAIARLYDRPVLEAAARLAQQHQREELDARLEAVRRRVLQLRLAQLTHRYTEIASALQEEQAELAAAETALVQAQHRVAAAGARVAELAVQERILREQQDRVRQQLVPCQPGIPGKR